MIGIRDGGLFSSGFSAESLKMRCFLSASSLDEELFPLSLFKRVTLRTGILISVGLKNGDLCHLHSVG